MSFLSTAVRNTASLFVAVAVVPALAGHWACAQTPIVPSAIAAHGLPIRADTVDGFAGDKDVRGWFGSYVYAVSRTTVAGKPAYLVTMDYTSKEKGTFQSDTLALDAATLNPLWRRFHARTDSASVTFNGRHASGWSLQNERNVKVDYELPATSFAGPMLRWILPSLPLAVGYQGAMSVFSIWKNAEDKALINVTGSETVDLASRKVDTWVLQSPSGARTWIDKSSGKIVQAFTPDGGRGSWLVMR